VPEAPVMQSNAGVPLRAGSVRNRSCKAATDMAKPQYSHTL